MTRDIRFPRIDGEQTPEIQRFNELVAQQPQFRLEDATNETVDYQIAYAGPELISVRFDRGRLHLGRRARQQLVQGRHRADERRRPLTEARCVSRRFRLAAISSPSAPWPTSPASSRDYRISPPERDVRETATKPHLWLITEQGLTILFPPYSFGGPYALGGAEVTIPWADLRPYLNPAAPAPIRPTA